MKKDSFWFKNRFRKGHIDILIGIPAVLCAFTSAVGIYSLKVYVALQEYFTKSVGYEVVLPIGTFFQFDTFFNVVITYTIAAFLIGSVISYSVNNVLHKH